MVMPVLAIDVRETAKRCADLIAKRQRAEVEELRRTAIRCERLIPELWKSTLERLEPYLVCGSPTSILRLVGRSHLEKPFNRIMKWCACERGEHGFGREFLKQLCAHLRFDEMTKYLDADEEIEVRGEEKVDSSGNMPDLLVWTRNERGAALMLENKVGSGESGDDQYASYLRWFPGFAGHRKRLTVLSARYNLESPPLDWDRFMNHEELAQVFHDLAKVPGIPIWGRIVGIQCAMALHNTEMDSIADLVRATRHQGRISILDWKTVLAFQPSAKPANPWEPEL